LDWHVIGGSEGQKNTIMKKIIFFLLVCGLGYSASAQNDSTTTTNTTTTTTTTHKYYYYPESNIYYDDVNGSYWYYDEPTTKWTMTQTLPSTVTLVKTPRYQISYNGTDPWKNNAMDVRKYKVKKNGKVKAKS
jgi:hypothetical protein